ncbi:MAG: CopG family transcriptional regulator [Armatimonadetes bacterium]|nr:CopG family transcriptional regulator [Armatimonadota bacterium]
MDTRRGGISLLRVQVQFTEEQPSALRDIARKEGLSFSHVVREGVNLLLRQQRPPSREELVRPSLEMLGQFRSGTGDLSAKHDEYSAEASEH